MKLRCNGLFVGLAQLFIILGVGFSTLFVNFSNAVDIDCDPAINNNPIFNQVFDLGLSEEINNSEGNYFELKSNANFLFNGTDKVFHYGTNSRGGWLFWASSLSGDISDSRLYSFWVGPYGGNTVVRDQGFINYYTVVSGTDRPCVGRNHPIEGFYNNPQFANPDKFGYFDTTYNGFDYCFIYSDDNYSVCFGGDNSYFSGSVGITVGMLENLSQYYQNSRFGSPVSLPDINIDPVCPTIGQKKANSGLSPDVCYAGFQENYSNGDSFIAGSGISIKRVYEMYSGGMSYQGWYDTYYQYYKDINNHLDIFSGNKLLMGTFFSRQTFGRDKTSQQILNYCHLVLDLGNMSDNTSCCVAQCNLTDVSYNENDYDSMIEELIGRANRLSISGDIDYTGSVFDSVDDAYSFWRGNFIAKEGFDGILPTYIVVGFLAMVFLYILKR